MSVLAGSYGLASNSYGLGAAATFADLFKVAYWKLKPLGVACVTMPTAAPFLRPVVVTASSTPSRAPLPFTVKGPVASAGYVCDIALDQIRKRAYLTGCFDGKGIYALTMRLPPEGCLAGPTCLAVGPGAEISVSGGGSISVL
eukprot:tig00000254_g22576.t1